jgi:hypothetical protein
MPMWINDSPLMDVAKLEEEKITKGLFSNL